MWLIEDDMEGGSPENVTELEYAATRSQIVNGHELWGDE